MFETKTQLNKPLIAAVLVVVILAGAIGIAGYFEIKPQGLFSQASADLTSGNTIKVDGIDDYVEVISNAALRPENAVTTEVWTYQDTWTTTRAGIMDHGDQGNNGYGIQVNRSGDNLISFGVRLNSCSTSFAKAGVSPGSLSGGWHHFVGTFDGSSVKFYVDGVLASSQSVTGTCSISYPYQYVLRFGKAAREEPGYIFAGKLDEARLYNRALSSAEVTTHYGAGSGEQGVAGENGLIAGWHFDETTGTTAADYSGNGLNGFTRGGAVWSARVPQPNAINDIAEYDITPTEAKISWTTIASTNSVIDYGTTTSYGSTVSDLALVNSHSQTLTGLSPNTTYHYRITSTPASGAPIVSSDQTFTTLDTPPTDNIFYVAPTGSSLGNGSFNNPWDLATVFAHPSSIEPGATIYLRGGSYLFPGDLYGYDSYLEGTEEEPITVTRYEDEWPVIDGNLTSKQIKNKSVLKIHGNFVYYKDFEITNTETTNRKVDEEGSGFEERRGTSVEDYAEGTKVINLILHDTGQGISGWQTGTNNEYYGNVIYNNGWDAPDRGHGHGFYTQNQTGYKHYTNNFSFNQFGANLQTGGTDSSAVRNMKWEGNTFFNGGTFMQGPHIENMQVLENYTWNQGFNIGNEVNKSYLSATVRDNYFMGPVNLYYFMNGAEFTNNTLWAPPESKNFVLSVCGDWTPDRHTIDNNTYHQAFTESPYWNFRLNHYHLPPLNGNCPTASGVDQSSYYAFNSTDGNQVDTFAYVCGSNNPTCALSWQENLGFDSHSTFIQPVTPGASTKPTVNKVVVHDNIYDPNRADLIIYNWELDNTVPVNVSATLSPGDTYELRNVQDYFGDVITGTYAGGELSVPMTGRTRAKPIGYDEVSTWYHDPLQPNTFPEFGAFILKKTSEGTPPPSDTTPPSVSVTVPTAGSTVSGTTQAITANATDAVGVVGVQFKLDGANLSTEDTTAPYSILWNTTTVTNGAHAITAIARDAAGNTKTSTAVSVTVSNTVTTPDTTPPIRSAGSPTGQLSAGTTTTTLSLATNETALCKYSTGSGSVGSMTNFTNTNSTTHTTSLTGLTNGQSYQYFIKCTDAANNTNIDDYDITFSVANSTTGGGGGGGSGGGGGPKPPVVPPVVPPVTTVVQGDNFKCDNNPTVYYFHAGMKEAYPERSVYEVWNGTNYASIKTITKVQCDAIPYKGLTRLPQGTFVKVADGPTVYRIEGNTARPIATYAAFIREARGKSINLISKLYLHSYSRGLNIN